MQAYNLTVPKRLKRTVDYKTNNKSTVYVTSSCLDNYFYAVLIINKCWTDIPQSLYDCVVSCACQVYSVLPGFKSNLDRTVISIEHVMNYILTDVFNHLTRSMYLKHQLYSTVELFV